MLFETPYFTYYKITEAENFLNEVLGEAAKLFENMFDKNETAALILIGGYGRGEGGVVQKNGVFRPHNNLDLLYIYNGKISRDRIDDANQALQSIAKKYDFGIDMSAINKEKLLTLDGLVVSYDMRFGHKTLLGNSDFLRNHNPFSIYNIDPVDIRQLLVNRGTLLLINRLLLSKEALSVDEKKLIIKHAIKAIIGYGDAMLYFHNKYHWSYAQKLTNMLEDKNIDESIKSLYCEAILFRFKPNYDKYLQKDLQTWNSDLIRLLSSVHLECERINLNSDTLEWDSYFKTALEKRSYPRLNIRQKAKACLHALKSPKTFCALDSLTQITSYLQLGGKGVLALLFPYIAYENYPEHYKKLFHAALDSEDRSGDSYLRGFLNLWSDLGDTNFKNVIEHYNIALEKKQ